MLSFQHSVLLALLFLSSQESDNDCRKLIEGHMLKNLTTMALQIFSNFVQKKQLVVNFSTELYLKKNYL